MKVDTSISSPNLNKPDNTDQSSPTKPASEKDESAGYSSSVHQVKSQNNIEALDRQDVDHRPELEKPTSPALDAVTHNPEIQAQHTNFEKEAPLSKQQVNEGVSKEIKKSEDSSSHGHSDSEVVATIKLDKEPPAAESFSGRAPNDPRELRKRNESK